MPYRPRTHSITLPSGRAVPVTTWEAAPPRELRALHICLECSAPRVYPVSWRELDGAFEVLLRCPDCEVFELGEFDDETLAAFERELDAADQALSVSLRLIEHDRFADQAERFSRALRCGAVWPADF